MRSGSLIAAPPGARALAPALLAALAALAFLAVLAALAVTRFPFHDSQVSFLKKIAKKVLLEVPRGLSCDFGTIFQRFLELQVALKIRCFFWLDFLGFSGGFRDQNGAKMDQKTSFRGVATITGRELLVGAVFAVCLGASPKRRNPQNLILAEAKLRFLLFARLWAELPKPSKPASKFKANVLAK